MSRRPERAQAALGPSPHGEGGLKLVPPLLNSYSISPSPHGEGGLKLGLVRTLLDTLMSLPSRGGWIEIDVTPPGDAIKEVPPLTGRVD